MAYSNVGTPRFYVDELSWLQSIGLISNYETSSLNPNFNPASSFELNPARQLTFQPSGNNTQLQIRANFEGSLKLSWENINFWGVLGHNFANYPNLAFAPRFNTTGGITAEYPKFKYIKEIINAQNSGGLFDNHIVPAYNGFSLVEVDGLETHNDSLMSRFYFQAHDISDGNIQPYKIIKIGSIIYGRYFEMPYSPELSLTMTREMDGIKRIRTKGGSDLINQIYTGCPKWGQLAAWELDTEEGYNQDLARSGRRTWELSFNHLQDSDIFSPTHTQHIIIHDTEGQDADDYYQSDNAYVWDQDKRFLEHDDFYTQVIHKTNGGQLPFIFQPDNKYFNPDGFAICKFDMDTFEFEQVANGIYNIKLKIREVW